MSEPLTAKDVEAMGLALDDEECTVEHVKGQKPHRHMTLPRADETARPPDPDALREALKRIVWMDSPDNPERHRVTITDVVSVARAALAAPAAPPPDLAALLRPEWFHPWTCTEHPDHRSGGGWYCQRAAADVAFRLGWKP